MTFFKAIFFDLNGTLIDIHTDESREEIYRTIANLLSGYGIDTTPEKFRTRFYDLMQQQRQACRKPHPEFDVLGIFHTILEQDGKDSFQKLAPAMQKLLPEFLALTFRAASMLQLKTYPGVYETLKTLQPKYLLGAVSDAQEIWAEHELRRLNLTDFFPTRVISSCLMCRKPSPEIFAVALRKHNLSPEQVIYVGNDMYRDVFGAKNLGMKSVFFRSNQGDHKFHGAEPDYIIYNFEELLPAVHFLEQQQQ